VEKTEKTGNTWNMEIYLETLKYGWGFLKTDERPKSLH
jgi:hypothetical protein